MSKTSDLPLPPQTMLNFSKMDGNKKVVGSTFLGAGGGGGGGKEWDELKAVQKIVIRSPV